MLICFKASLLHKSRVSESTTNISVHISASINEHQGVNAIPGKYCGNLTLKDVANIPLFVSFSSQTDARWILCSSASDDCHVFSLPELLHVSLVALVYVGVGKPLSSHGSMTSLRASLQIQPTKTPLYLTFITAKSLVVHSPFSNSKIE